MGAIVIRTRYDKGTESAEVATSGIVVCERNVGTEVKLQTGTYTLFRPRANTDQSCIGPGPKSYIDFKLGRATV